MSPISTRRSRRSGAFTLAELLVASAASVFLASIIYTAGSEMLLAFARNISINRSYSDARLALERIAQTVETAGHTPVLINNDGLTLATTSPAAGIRFYRTDPAPINTAMIIPSGLSTDTRLVVTIPTGQSTPLVGDKIAIPAIGFQSLVTAVSGAAPTVTLVFGGSTIASGCIPALSMSYIFQPIQPFPTPPATQVPQPICCSCLLFTQVEFVTVGTQLRYYPRAPTTSTAFNTQSNYKVITNLVANPSNTNQLLPFSLGPAPTISVTLCAQGPDYNNVSNIHASNLYTQMQTSLASRNPVLLQGPF